MADLYAVAQTYGNDGNAVTASALGANARRVVGPDGYTTSSVGGARTYAGPFTRFGTRELKFYNISIADHATNYTNSGSVFAKVIEGLQRVAEIYIIGTPSSTNCVYGIALDTDNGAVYTLNGVNAGAQTVKAAVDAATGGNATVTSSVGFSGNSITFA